MSGTSYTHLRMMLRQHIVAVATLTEDKTNNWLSQKKTAQFKSQRVPVGILEYGRLNGLQLAWTAHAYPQMKGRVFLQSVPDIYGPDYEKELYFRTPGEDPRLPCFRPVDIPTTETMAGLFHDEFRSPELYFYNVDGEPLSTGVDLHGYFELLLLSLGFYNWQTLLVQLASPAGQGRPSRVVNDTYYTIVRHIVDSLTQLVPGFTLEQFVARYDEVKLPSAQTWAVMAGHSSAR